MGGHRLGELRLRGGQPPLRLVDAPLRVGARLPDADLALAELLAEHRDLVLGQAQARLGLPHHGLGLLLARADLRVVEHREHLPGLARGRPRAP